MQQAISKTRSLKENFYQTVLLPDKNWRLHPKTFSSWENLIGIVKSIYAHLTIRNHTGELKRGKIFQRSLGYCFSAKNAFWDKGKVSVPKNAFLNASKLQALKPYVYEAGVLKANIIFRYTNYRIILPGGE